MVVVDYLLSVKVCRTYLIPVSAPSCEAAEAEIGTWAASQIEDHEVEHVSVYTALYQELEDGEVQS